MILAPIVLAASLSGFYFEQTTTAGGQAPVTVTTRVWVAGRRMRMESGDAFAGSALILRLDMNKAYRLDLADRTVEHMDLDRMKAESQMGLSMAGDVMGGGEGGNPRTETLPGRTVAGFVCTGHRIRIGDTVMDVFVSPKVPIGLDDFSELLEWTGAGQSLGGLLGEMRRLPGFPLETRTRVRTEGGIQETVSKITVVRKAQHDATLFEPPAAYEKVKSEEGGW